MNFSKDSYLEPDSKNVLTYFECNRQKVIPRTNQSCRSKGRGLKRIFFASDNISFVSLTRTDILFNGIDRIKRMMDEIHFYGG